MTHQPIPLIQTRPRDRAEGFVARLDAETRALIRPVYAPLWDIVGTKDTPPPFDCAIFTSTNGVRHGPAPQARAAYCVGRATTKAAREAGWEAEFAGIDAQALVQELRKRAPTQSLLHISGATTRGAVSETLAVHGMNAARFVAYEQRPLPLSNAARTILREERCIVPLFSPAGAAHFGTEFADEALAMTVVAISPATAAAVSQHSNWRTVVAQTPDADAMGAEVSKLVQAAQSG